MATAPSALEQKLAEVYDSATPRQTAAQLVARLAAFPRRAI